MKIFSSTLFSAPAELHQDVTTQRVPFALESAAILVSVRGS